MFLPITNSPYQALEAFRRFRSRGVFHRARARLLSKKTALASLEPLLPQIGPNRAYAGLQDIPVRQITGTASRENDFDHEFHPLHPHLGDRWAAVYLVTRQGGAWDPIRVYQVGEEYFVEDGHHRVSVARATGMAFIQAEVWELAWQPAGVQLQNRTEPKLRVRTLPAAASCSIETCPSGQTS